MSTKFKYSIKVENIENNYVAKLPNPYYFKIGDTISFFHDKKSAKVEYVLGSGIDKEFPLILTSFLINLIILAIGILNVIFFEEKILEFLILSSEKVILIHFSIISALIAFQNYQNTKFIFKKKFISTKGILEFQKKEKGDELPIEFWSKISFFSKKKKIEFYTLEKGETKKGEIVDVFYDEQFPEYAKLVSGNNDYSSIFFACISIGLLILLLLI